MRSVTYSLLFLLGSCTAIIGLREPRPQPPSQLRETGAKWGIPAEHSYIIDTGYLRPQIRSGEAARVPVKNLAQPLQLRVYDASGRLAGFMANCHAGGFPNLGWNKHGQLDSLPPHNYADTTLFLEKDILNFRTFEGGPVDTAKYKGNDYTIVVFWTRWMNRQSRVMLEALNTYISRNSDKKIGVLYVNAEPLFY